MQFVDLNSGYSFEALWKTNQENGYIFWFPNEQSIKLTYTMPICICVSKDDQKLDNDGNPVPLKLTIENNDTFSFIQHDDTTLNIEGYEFTSPIYLNEVNTTVEKVDNLYLHLFYIAAKSDITGEFICDIDINNEGFIKVGADFYDEYEPAYINLSNFGVEIPEYVQKAIYDSNVHEDYKDNILINRKFKELISNYWNVIANKGSYKSLINSLGWFEWGDNIKIREIWKYHNGYKFMYDDKELCSLLKDNFVQSLSNFIKTTYISLYANAFKCIDSYDSEENPKLEKVIYKWGKDDLMLKISLLSEFFKGFFMPVHSSILHAALEDITFTNTIKVLYDSNINRVDHVEDFSVVDCNINKNDIFRISNVRAQVTKDTIYAIDYNKQESNGKYKDLFFGVDDFGKNGIVDNDSIKSFSLQYYTGPGVIIPIKFNIKNINEFEKIHKTIVWYKTNDSSIELTNNTLPFEFNDIFESINGKIEISFNLLIKGSGNHELSFMFITTDGRTLNKQLTFSTIDVDNLHLQLYKITAKNKVKFNYSDWDSKSYNDYIFRIQPNINSYEYDDNGNPIKILNNTYYTQYLPYMDPSHKLYKYYKGIKLNRTVIFDVLNSNGKDKPYDEVEVSHIRNYMSRGFLEFYKKNESGEISYLIYVSKKFYGKLPLEIELKNYNIIRNELVFYPQFHEIVPMNGNKIEDYTVNQYEAICCGVEIKNSKNNVIPFRYGHLISSTEWSFINSSTLKEIKHPMSVRQPFVANDNYNYLADGYYDIKFKYSLINGKERELILNSGFRKISI